jgi:hypothetical protein
VAELHGGTSFLPDKVAVNAWLLDNFDVNSAPTEVIDGRNLW